MLDHRRDAAINVKALLILVIVTVVLSSGLVAAYHVQQRAAAEEALTAGMAALDRQDWPEACRRLKRYLLKHPDDLEILERYAQAHLAVQPLGPENLASAISAYRRLFRDRVEDIDLARLLIRLCVRHGEFDQAVLIHERVADRDDPQCTLWWARAMLALRRAPEAAEGLKRVALRHPQEVDAWLMLCQIELQADTEPARLDALQWLDRAVAHNPGSAEARVRRAWFHRSVRQDPHAAHQEMVEAEGLAAEHPGVLLARAEEWLHLDEWDRAAEHLRALEAVDEAALNAHDLDPGGFFLARFTLAARLCLARSDAEGGKAIADRALVELSDPARKLFLPTALELYVNGGRAADARKCYDEYRAGLASSGGQVGALADPLETLEALVLLAEDQPQLAEDRLRQLIARNPQNLPALKLLSMAAERMGKDDDARRALEEYLSLRPSDAAVARRLAQMYAGRDWGRALGYVNQAERAGPASVETALLRIEAEINLAGDTLDGARSAALADEIVAILQAHPADARARVLSARLLARRGRYDEAIADLEAALADTTDAWEIAGCLAQLHKDHGKLDRAIDVCRSAVERQPDLAAPRIALSKLQAQDGRKDEARRTLEHAVSTLTFDEQVRARSALIDHFFTAGQRSEAIQMLTQAAADRPSDIRPRLALLALPEIQSEWGTCQRLIDEIKVAEGERGLSWKTEQAGLWLRSGEWKQRADEIESMLRACIEADPIWAPPAMALGRLHELRGDLNQAEQTYRRALDSAPLESGPAIGLLALLGRQHRYAAAQEALDDLAPGMPEVSGQRVEIALGRGDYESAIEELEKRVARDARDAPSRVWLARLLYETRQIVAASLRLLDEAAAIAPELPSILATRVFILHESGQADDAVALLDAEVARRNDFASHALRAELYAAIGRIDLAEKDYLRLTEFSELAAEGHAALGQFYELSGKREEAIAAWRQGLSVAPDHPETRRRLMKALLGRQRADEQAAGSELLKPLLESHPEDPELLSARAAVLLAERSPESAGQAFEVLERVVRLAPYHVGAYLTLIRMAREHGDPHRAAELAAAALTANPGRSQLHLAAAGIEADSGNLAAAREMVTALLHADPQNIPARNLLVTVALRSGELERAAELNNEVLRLDPRDPKSQLARADLLSRTGRRAEAIQVLEGYLRTAPTVPPLDPVLLLADLGRPENAPPGSEKWVKEALSAYPEHVNVELAHLRWATSKHDYDRMVARFAAGPPADAETPPDIVAMLLAKNGEDRRLDAARERFDRLIAADQNRLEGHLELAQVAYRLGELDASRQAYERVLAIKPDHQRALNDLAWIVGFELKDPAGGLALADRAVISYPDDPHLRDTRGVLLHLLNRPDEARKELERSVELSRGIPRTQAGAMLHLGRLHLQQGSKEQAKSNMLAAQEIDRLHNVLTDHDRAEIHRVVGTP